jgi:acyl carrier protein
MSSFQAADVAGTRERALASDVAERTRAFVARAVRTRELDDTTDIFEAGYVNSLFLAQLLTFVENDLGTRVDDDDLTIDNFRSIEAIVRFVARKQGAG